MPGGARVIAKATDESPLTALLREVNETMLGRALTFASETGASLTLEVSGRRILRLVGAEGLEGAESCLSAPTLEDAHKDDLLKLMQALALPRQELRVTAIPIDREREGISVGLPIALLADLLLLDLNPAVEANERAERPRTEIVPKPEAKAEPAPMPPKTRETGPAPILRPVTRPEPVKVVSQAVVGADFLGRFARATGPVLMAWLIVGGDEDGSTEGPEEMVSHLQGFLEEEAESVAQQLDLIANVPGGPICIVLGATLAEGHSILCARFGEGFLLGVIEGDGTKTLMQAWTAALA